MSEQIDSIAGHPFEGHFIAEKEADHEQHPNYSLDRRFLRRRACAAIGHMETP